MFLSGEYPERYREPREDAWDGTYKGHPMEVVEDEGRYVVWYQGEPVAFAAGDNIAAALHNAKCGIDWALWIEKWQPPSQDMFRRLRLLIFEKLDEAPERASLDEWGLVGFALNVGQWVNQKAHIDSDAPFLGWFDGLKEDDRYAFVGDVLRCWRVPDLDTWKEVAFGGERPLTLAEQKERREAEKAKRKPKPKRAAMAKPRRQEPELIPQAPFGTCQRCPGICVRWDVRQGCCTVCGGPLTALNPKGNYIDSPHYHLQLFIPRHEKDWKGVPKRTLPQRVLERDGHAGLDNKPAGSFWTSTLGTDDEGNVASDWDQWMRNSQHEWHVPKGIVLEVSDDANVKHLRTKSEAEDFLDEYGVPGHLSEAMGEPPRKEAAVWGGGTWWGLFQMVPDWIRVYDEFDGLHLEGGALGHPAFYGWDAESTAWFNTDHLTEVGKVDLPEAEDPYEENPPPRRRPRHKRKRQANGKLTPPERRRLFRSLMRRA